MFNLDFFFGYSTINIPLFKDEVTNLPWGLQIVAKRYDDFALFDFAEIMTGQFT